MSLSQNCVAKMQKVDHAKDKLYVVEVNNVTKSRGNYLTLTLFDGTTTARGIIEGVPYLKNLKNFKKKDSFKLMIHEFKTYEWYKKKIIEIIDCSLINDTNSIKKEIPSQTSIVLITPKNPPPPRTLLAPIKYESSSHTVRKSRFIKYQLQPESPEPTRRKSVLDRPLMLVDSEEQETKANDIDDFQVIGFEKIEDLYIGLHAWQLIVRVLDKTYREFTSKQGKEIQLLTLEFIDRTGCTIQCIFFGQQAERHNQDITKGKVYRVSRTRIEEELFSWSKKTEKQSPFTLKFHSDSSILEVRDVPEIPYSTNNKLRLDQISQALNEEHNIIAILLQIGQEKTLQKQERTITMQTLVVGDPITNTLLEVVIWNKQMTVDHELANKSVMLKQFKVKQYKEDYTLNSSFRSTITKDKYFEEYENTWKPNLAKKTGEDVTTLTLKELDSHLQNIQEGSGVVSYVRVWTSIVDLDNKWHYESCPNQKCKKAAEAYIVCKYCAFEVEQPVKRFTLPVELCDYTGSLLVVAFNEAADVFVKGKGIDEIEMLSEAQRHTLGIQLTYENYQVKLISRLDKEGRIKHSIIGKPEAIDSKESSLLNLSQIRKLQIEELCQPVTK